MHRLQVLEALPLAVPVHRHAVAPAEAPHLTVIVERTDPASTVPRDAQEVARGVKAVVRHLDSGGAVHRHRRVHRGLPKELHADGVQTRLHLEPDLRNPSSFLDPVVLHEDALALLAAAAQGEAAPVVAGQGEEVLPAVDDKKKAMPADVDWSVQRLNLCAEGALSRPGVYEGVVCPVQQLGVRIGLPHVTQQTRHRKIHRIVQGHIEDLLDEILRSREAQLRGRHRDQQVLSIWALVLEVQVPSASALEVLDAQRVQALVQPPGAFQNLPLTRAAAGA
mmetsp:Transcript_80650/g.193422  ORF Transcript_80650/g.193422 Transcript_80650/m.193422 type:complete len:279 (-) Transcript_80650:389-1225(-)